MILLCAVCSARILWNHLGFLGITCDFEFGTGKRHSLSLLGLLRMLDFTLAGNDLDMPLCHSSFLHCIYVCCVVAGYVWWSFHPVDSIIDSLLLIHCSSVYFFRLFSPHLGLQVAHLWYTLCAVCCARILWNRLGFLGITCDFEFGTGKRRSLSLLGLIRMIVSCSTSQGMI